MALPAILLSEMMVALRAAAPAVIGKISARIGSNATVGGIMAAIKNNKITAALVGLELYGPASDFIVRLIGSDESMDAIVNQLTASLDYKPDSAAEIIGNKDVDLLKFGDEFELIGDVSGILGGYDAAVKLRNFLAIDTSVFKLYEQVRALRGR